MFHQLGIQSVLTAVTNQQLNAIIERVYQIIRDILRVMVLHVNPPAGENDDDQIVRLLLKTHKRGIYVVINIIVNSEGISMPCRYKQYIFT